MWENDLLASDDSPTHPGRPMKKIRLDADALDVLSFTVAEGAGEPGTVQANDASLASCQLAASCIGPCRPNTVDPSCHQC
jgi:hypothetical protein